MWKSVAALTLLVAVSCAPATGTPPITSSSAAPSMSAWPTATPGAFTMPTEPGMITFAADRGALIAFSTKSGPAPYESKVQRADPATRAWRTVHASDSAIIGGQVVAGRAAMIEYREPVQGGGAYSDDFTVVDLSTGKATAIDRFAMSPATFRGGGGRPRRPAGSIVLGPDRVAWTRLTEGPGGSGTGQLRVAPLAAP